MTHIIYTIIKCIFHTSFCGHEESCFWSEILYFDIIVKDGFRVVRHEWHQVILKNHFAIVKIETSDLNIKIEIEDLILRGLVSKINIDINIAFV